MNCLALAAVMVAVAAPPSTAQTGLAVGRTGTGSTLSYSRVSLDFANAPVAQILKALALQADANIVIVSPLKATATVKLKSVTVTQALDFVCAAAGIKWSQVGNTIVVGSGSAFDTATMALASRGGTQNTIMVVPIVSGDAGGIKYAMQKWFSPSSLEVMTPSDASKGGDAKADGGDSGAPDKAAPPTSALPGGMAPPSLPAAGGAAGAKAGDSSGGGAKADYLILIGEPKWVEQGRRIAVDLDHQILQGRSAKSTELNDILREPHADWAQEVYEVHSTKAGKLKAVLAQDTILRNVSIFASPDESDRQILIIEGPKETVQRTLSVLRQLDTGSVSAPVQEAYDVRSCKASKLKEIVIADSRYKSVTVYAAPDDSLRQTLILDGPKDDVERAISLIRQLDQGGSPEGDTELEMVGLKYIRPSFAKVRVMQEVPGLLAEFLPLTVDPMVATTYSETAETQIGPDGKPLKSDSGSGAAAGTAGGAAGASSGSSGSSSAGSGATGGPSAGSQMKSAVSTYTNSIPMKLILRGTKAQIALGKKFLTMVDLAPKQVAIELRVMSLTKSDAINAGLDWSILTGGAVKILRLNNSQASASNSTAVHISSGNFNGDVLATLDKITTNSNLISRPNIMAMDGLESTVFVGDTIRYVQSITSGQNGPSVTTDSLKVGISLDVVPRIGDTGEIALAINTAISFLKGFTAVPGGGNLPQTSDRSAQNTVSLSSGETIAIGGLIQDSDGYTATGVPILMNLPIIGNLFRKTNKTRDRTELVIFLTAKATDTPMQSSGSTLPMLSEHFDLKGVKKP